MTEILNMLKTGFMSGFAMFAEWVLMIATVTIMVIAWIKCVTPVRNANAQLRRGMKKLKKQGSENAWQDPNFLGNGPLSASWVQFLYSRRFADETYNNACPVSDYINEDTVINDVGFTGFADAVPGLMVSLGFLGTLIGIVMGLVDFNMDSADTTMEAIRTLMSGMRYAFGTSIVGVLCSVTFNIVLKTAHGSARKTIGKFYKAVQQQGQLSTVDPITQIAIYQQEQTTMMASLAKDITGELTNRIGAAVEMALQPVQESLDNFIDVTSKRQMEGLDRIVDAFILRMNEALEGNFKELGDAMGEMARTQHGAMADIEANVASLHALSLNMMKIEQKAEEIAASFGEYTGKVGDAQQGMADAYALVSDNVKSMEAVARQQANYIAKISQLQSDFMKEVASFRLCMEELSKSFSDNAASSAEAIRRVSDGLEESGKNLLNAQDKFAARTDRELQHTFDMFDQNMNDIVDKLTTVINGISESVEDMPAIMNESAVKYANQMQQFTRYMEQLSRNIDAIVKGQR